jgi:hypothetical protein
MNESDTASMRAAQTTLTLPRFSAEQLCSILASWARKKELGDTFDESLVVDSASVYLEVSRFEQPWAPFLFLFFFGRDQGYTAWHTVIMSSHIP